jgi:tetratricopeptide (TPR) repeat protein
MENTNYTLQENIQSLINGELDETARQALLEQAQADPQVADELGFSQSLARALRHRELVTASAVLSAVIAEEGFPPPAPPSAAVSGGKWWVWASTVAIILSSLVGGYFWAESAGLFASRTQKIARTVLQPLENVLFLPNNGQALTDFQSGMAAYDAGRYDEAARLLDVYVSRTPDNAARVYLGVARLKSNQSKEAIPPLADAAQSPEPPIQEAALWYLALAYLENNNASAAIQALEAIPADGIYGAQAGELLGKLSIK